MKLFVFSSKSIEHIRIGVQAETWAVPRPATDSTMRGYETKASGVEVGNFGIFWFRSKITTPFMFVSKPDPSGRSPRLWFEDYWVLPFRFRPLGSPNILWRARDAGRTLPSIKIRRGNLARRFNHAPSQVFTPIEIGEADWAMIVANLAEPPKSNEAVVLPVRQVVLPPAAASLNVL
jgi:hypothetical protein